MLHIIMTALVLADTAQVPVPPPAEFAAERVQYEAAWFAQFSPGTALDMARRTPGFVLMEPDEKRRGYSGAVGNVLVDGERPTTKDQTLEQILQRIPARQVARMEVLRGAAASGDASGQAMLLNVVRLPFTTQGWWTLGAEYAAQHRLVPNASLTATGRFHDVDFGIGASSYGLRRELPGEQQSTDAGGRLLTDRRVISPRDYIGHSVNGEASTDAFGGRVRATWQARYSRYHEGTRYHTVSPAPTALALEINPYTESKRAFEIGTQFQRDVGKWDLTTVALLTRSRFESDNSSTKLDATAALQSLFTSALAQDSGESILRASLARELTPMHRIEAGLEGAINTLDARQDLTLDLGDGPFPIIVPTSNVAVEEHRGEGFVVHFWRIGARWSVESRLAAEMSQLSFSRDDNRSVDLEFLKPSLQLTRPFATNSQLRLGLKREVGQLDFTDFVSVASLPDERIEGGNPGLKPQTAWSAELGADLRLRTDTAVSVGVFHRWLRDTVDLIPLETTEGRIDAPGNLGAGRAYGLTLTARTPLPSFIPGGSFNVETTLTESSITDPLTGREREISELERVQLKAGLRQELREGRYAWGLDYKRISSTRIFLLNEIDAERKSPSLDAFVEAALPGGTRLRVAMLSVLGSTEWRERFLFTPDRSSGLAEIERTRRAPGHWLLLTLSGGF